jgi:pyruvate formate-lyase activating enzyme-like uncharacterized protein
MKLLAITKSSRKDKKFMAMFDKNNKTIRVHFGATGYQDYTQHHDKKRRDSYRARHSNDKLKDPTSPGALSYYILWGDSKSIRTNIASFRERFNV